MTDFWLNLLFNLATVVHYITEAFLTAVKDLPRGVMFYALLHGSIWLATRIYKGEPLTVKSKSKRRTKTAISTVETSHVNVHSLFS